MKIANDFYSGREHSFIKHRFLVEYIQACAYKIFQSRSKTFNFVDAFAGPWKIQDTSDLSDASFHQAVDVISKVKDVLRAAGHYDLRVRFCLCEKRADSAAKLREFAKRHSKIDILVFEGKFEENAGEIYDACSDGFTFTFIDPTGWNIDSQIIFSFLKKMDGEFLINFMEEHVGRHADFEGVIESFGRFLADPLWRLEFERLPHSWSNEARVLEIFRQKAKTAGAAKYVVDFPIWKPRAKRIKMRLLLGTNSIEGVRVFRETQGKLEKVESALRNRIRYENSPQASLFDDEEIAAIEQGLAGIGCPTNKEAAAQQIQKIFENVDEILYKDLSAQVMETVPVRQTHLNKIVIDLKNSGQIDFRLAARQRVPKPETMIEAGAST